MLAIVGAMAEEVTCLLSRVKVTAKEVVGQTEVYRAEGPRGPFLVAKSGIGKVAAAASTQILITKYGADRILFSGVAGGLKDGIPIWCSTIFIWKRSVANPEKFPVSANRSSATAIWRNNSAKPIPKRPAKIPVFRNFTKDGLRPATVSLPTAV